MLEKILIENPPFIRAKHFRKGRIKPVELIVIHTMEAPEKGSTAENIANYFKRGERVASAHYCIDNDSLVQCVYDSNTAYACKNANSNGVQLEHAGFAKQTADDWNDEFSKSMLEISAQISAYLCNKFNIPIQKAEFKSANDSKVLKKGFCGHADVPNHGSHWDPGTSFPMEEYLEKVKKFFAEYK